jgi:PAS domain S-box-containing protein
MIAEDLKTLKRITDTLVSNGYLVDQTKEWEYAFDAVPDAIFVINTNHKIRFVNKKLAGLLNKTKDEVFNKDCYEVIFGDVSLCDFSSCKEEPQEAGEVFLDRLRGWYQITQAPIKSTTGKLLGFICILRDITDVEVKRRELAASEKKYRTLVKYAPAALYEVDFTNFRLSSVNDVMCEYTGYTREELLELDVRNLLTAESLKIFVDRIKLAMDGKPVKPEVELEIIRKDGSPYWTLLHTSYRYNDAGFPLGARVVALDINDKKIAQIEADRKTNLLESIYKASPGGIGVVRYPDREILWVNEKVCDILGYTKEELVGFNAKILYPTEEDYKKVGAVKYDLMGKTPDGVGAVKTRLMHKNGSIIPVLLISAKILGEEDRVVFNILDLDMICEHTSDLAVCI